MPEQFMNLPDRVQAEILNTVAVGMFYGTPSFDEIIKDVRELEQLINLPRD